VVDFMIGLDKLYHFDDFVVFLVDEEWSRGSR
jgi:hypothetical protein